MPIDSVGTFSERRIRILIPEQHIPFGGKLESTALYSVPQNPAPGGLPTPGDPPQPIVSDPLVITLVRGAPKVLVLGDSVAWGQGLQFAQKAGAQVFSNMVERYH